MTIELTLKDLDSLEPLGLLLAVLLELGLELHLLLFNKFDLFLEFLFAIRLYLFLSLPLFLPKHV